MNVRRLAAALLVLAAIVVFTTWGGPSGSRSDGETAPTQIDAPERLPKERTRPVARARTAVAECAADSTTADVPQESPPATSNPAVSKLSGTVVDVEGRPIEKATLVPRQRVQPDACVTGADGAFAFNVSERNTPFDLMVSAPGFLARDVRADPSDDGVRVVLQRAATVRGVVCRTDGTAVAGAEVYAPADGRARARQPVTTGPDGRFAVEVPAAGDVILRADAEPVRLEAYALDTPRFTAEVEVIPPDVASGREIEMRGAARTFSFARLEFADPDDPKLVGLDLTAPGVVALRREERVLAVAFELPPDTEVRGRLTTAEVSGGTNADGSVLWTARARGVWEVGFKTSSRADVGVTQVAPPQGPQLRLRLADPTRGDAVRGRRTTTLLDVDRGVVLASEWDFSEPGTTMRLRPGGRYAVVVQDPVVSRTFSASEAADGPILLDVSTSTVVRGRVVDHEGTPSAGVRVVNCDPLLERAYSAAIRRWARVETRTDRDGRFAMAFGAGSEPVLVILGEAIDVRGNPPVPSWSARLPPKPGDCVDLGDIRLPQLVAIRGSVRGPTGERLAGAEVFVRTDYDSPEDSVRSDASGEFELRLPLGSRCKLLVTKTGYGARSKEIDVAPGGEAGVQFTLGPGGCIRVHRRKCGIQRDDAITVRTALGRDRWTPRRTPVATPRADEEVFLLDGLPVDRIDVATGYCEPMLHGEIDVFAGRTVDVTLE